MTQFYIVRHFNRIPMRYDHDEDDIYGEVVKAFENQDDLLEYCQEENIKLGIEYECDDSGQNYVQDTWVVYGYDYTIVTLDELIDQVHKISGKSFTR